MDVIETLIMQTVLRGTPTHTIYIITSESLP